MPRSGRNPQRGVSSLAPPASITVTTMVHVPELAGYWAESLAVLDLCLESVRRSTSQAFDLVVLDNGSCDEVAAHLHRLYLAGEIDRLISSRRNLGKVGGWNVLFAAAEGETVVYADSDIYFLPGWLEASQAVLAAFPEAAMVTAQPIPGDLSLHCDATLVAAADDPTVEWREGNDLIPPSYVESHRLSLGETPAQYAARIRSRREVRLRRGDARAYVSASHLQFLARREVLGRFFPMTSRRPMGDVGRLDEKLDQAGCWRLSTVDYLIHHMGNRPPDLASEVPFVDLDSVAAPPAPTRKAAAGWRRWLLAREPVRRLLKRIHHRSHRLLYPE